MEFDRDADYQGITHTVTKVLMGEMPFGRPEAFVNIFPVSVHAFKDPNEPLFYASSSLVIEQLEIGKGAKFGIDRKALIKLVKPLRKFMSMFPNRDILNELVEKGVKSSKNKELNIYYLHYYEPFLFLAPSVLRDIFQYVLERFPGIWICSLNICDIVRSQEIADKYDGTHFGLEDDEAMEEHQVWMRIVLPYVGFFEVEGSGYWVRF